LQSAITQTLEFLPIKHVFRRADAVNERHSVTEWPLRDDRLKGGAERCQPDSAGNQHDIAASGFRQRPAASIRAPYADNIPATQPA
jgi:hypothetical protein